MIRAQGWISGLSETQGELHPTRGGLRIGKPLPERPRGAPFDEQLEWDRDGQYFHYLTKWMHALDQVSRATRDARFNTWARELAEAAHRSFTGEPHGHGAPRMVWKMSIDLSRPLVPSMGQHDPLDGLITCLQLQATACALPGAPREPDLAAVQTDFATLIERRPVGDRGPTWNRRPADRCLSRRAADAIRDAARRRSARAAARCGARRSRTLFAAGRPSPARLATSGVPRARPGDRDLGGRPDREGSARDIRTLPWERARADRIARALRRARLGDRELLARSRASTEPQLDRASRHQRSDARHLPGSRRSAAAGAGRLSHGRGGRLPTRSRQSRVQRTRTRFSLSAVVGGCTSRPV